MTQDLTGGYCPKCDTVWAAPGVCKCVSKKDSLSGTAINARYQVAQSISVKEVAATVANQLAEDSSLCRMIWNEAIEAAAILLRDTNRNGTDDVALVRKLKK